MSATSPRGMIFDPSPFLPCNTPCPLPGGPELLPRPHGHLPFEGWAWGASLGWGGPSTITSRSPLVMDSSSTRNCRSSTFLQGERGLSELHPEGWALPSQQWQREPRPQVAQSPHSGYAEDTAQSPKFLETSSPPNLLIHALRREHWLL